MSTAVVTVTVNPTQADVSERYTTHYGSIAIGAGDYVTAGGLTLSFAGKVPHAVKPVEVRIWSEDPADIYDFRYATGTTAANGKIMVFVPDSDAELTSTALDTTVVNDAAIKFSAKFVKGR